MKYLHTIYSLFLIVVILFCYYGMFRSTKALHYINQLSIHGMYMNFENHDSFVKDIYNRYTYYDYFFSFKPLKSEYWFTKEEVNKYHDNGVPIARIDEVLDWLREEKKIHIGFGYSPRKKWRHVVMYMDDRFYNKPTLTVDGFLKIEHAAIAVIEYVIDNLI